MLRKIYDFIVSCDDTVFSEKTFMGGLMNIWLMFLVANIVFFTTMMILFFYGMVISTIFGAK